MRVEKPQAHRRDKRRAISCSDRGRGWGVFRCKALASVARQDKGPSSKRWTMQTGPAFERVSHPCLHSQDSIGDERTTDETAAVDRPARLASADATHQRDSLVHRIARGFARTRRSRAAAPATSAVGPTTSPTRTTSPPPSPVQQLASPSIRSPTSLPSASPPVEYERNSVLQQQEALALRDHDDTPIPSPPAAALAEPTYERPRPFRTLNWSFLPSRSARVVANRRPVIDRPLNNEERELVEVAAKVPDDGTTRDRWDNPIGIRGDWGRTVLSERLGSS